MPNTALVNLARKAGATYERAEKLWDESKALVPDKFEEGTSPYYAYLTGIVKRRLGMSEKKEEAGLRLLPAKKRVETASGWEEHRNKYGFHAHTPAREPSTSTAFHEHPSVQSFKGEGGKTHLTSHPSQAHVSNGKGQSLHHTFSEGLHHVTAIHVGQSRGVVKHAASHHNLGVALHHATTGLQHAVNGRTKVAANVLMFGQPTVLMASRFQARPIVDQSNFLLNNVDHPFNSIEHHDRLFDAHHLMAHTLTQQGYEDAARQHHLLASQHFDVLHSPKFVHQYATKIIP